ncbi:cytochrome P450 [Aspergillus insuetus]
MFKHLSEQRPEVLDDRAFLMVITEMELEARTTGPLNLCLFAVMAALHPDEMRYVQNEIDRVVGRSRLPTFDDQSSLPYLHAFMTESQRLYPLVPLSFARFRIPADAIIVPNQWAINMDAATYPNPKSFQPQRWLDNPSLPLPGTFGYGRRMCSGRHLANTGLFIAMASMAWAFEFADKTPGLSVETGLVRSMLFCPQTSGVGVSLRSDAHGAVIKREREAMDTDMSLHLNEIGLVLGNKTSV